jgi:hypothetical protein
MQENPNQEIKDNVEFLQYLNKLGKSENDLEQLAA